VLLLLCIITWIAESGKTAAENNNKMETKKEESLPAPVEQICCPIMELRQYTLHPGKRDILIDLFDQEFVETQEAVGIKVVGQFRDLDHPNRFVWLRPVCAIERQDFRNASASSDKITGSIEAITDRAVTTTRLITPGCLESV